MSDEVHEDIESIKKTLYGIDGTGGIVGCLKKKVSTRVAMWIIACFILPMVVTGIGVWSAQSSDPLRYASIGTVNMLEQRMILCEERYNTLIKALETLGDRMNKHSERIDKHCDEMKDQLREIKKDMDERNGGGINERRQ